MNTLTLSEVKRSPGRPRKVEEPKPEPMTWAQFKDALRDKEASTCWFPNAPVFLLEIGNNIMVRVRDGEPAYQLVTGEIVKL